MVDSLLNPPQLGDPLKVQQNQATSTQTSGSGYDATTVDKQDVADYDAFTQGVSNTTQGLLGNLLQQSNPYMQNAKYMGEAQAQNRGLLNSSLSAEAAQRAAIQAALPIAQQDAQLYQTQDLANQQAINQASQFGANWQNQFGTANQAALNQASQFGAQAQNTASLANQASADQMSLANQQNALQTQQLNQATQSQYELANLEAQSRYGLTGAELDEQQRRLSMELQNRVDLELLAQVNRVELQGLEQQFQENLQRLTGAQALEIQTLTDQNQFLISSNAVAADTYSKFMNEANELLQSATLDDASRTDALNTLKTELQNTFDILGGISSIDYGQYFA